MEYQKLPNNIAKTEQEHRMNVTRTDHFFYRYSVTTPWTRPESSHTHSLFELIYFMRGDAHHVVEDRVYKLSRGDLIIVQPGKYHDIPCFPFRSLNYCFNFACTIIIS